MLANLYEINPKRRINSWKSTAAKCFDNHEISSLIIFLYQLWTAVNKFRNTILNQRTEHMKLLSTLLIFAGGLFTAAHAQDGTLLYKISGNGLEEPSYVFGTVHLMCPDELYFSPELKEAVAGASQVVFEVDTDDPNLMQDMQAGVMMESGKTLKSLYTEDEYALIDAFVKESTGQSVAMMNTVKPFYLLSMMYMQYLGCMPASMEMQLMNLKSEGVEVLGIETIQEQMDAIDSLGMDVQAAMLLESVQEYDEQKEMLLKTVEMYKKGDAQALFDYSMDEMEGYGNFGQIMLVDRNQKWISRMEDFMKEGPTFFGVGAAHLGGDNGVLELLKKEGFEVVPVEQTKDDR